MNQFYSVIKNLNSDSENNPDFKYRKPNLMRVLDFGLRSPRIRDLQLRQTRTFFTIDI